MHSDLQQAILVWRYQQEIKRQCEFALRGFGMLEEAVSSYRCILGRLPHEIVHDEGVVEGSQEYYARLAEEFAEEQKAEQAINEHGSLIWFCIQAILVSIGNISKLLWPGPSVTNTTVLSAREELRTSLSVDNASVLKSRKFRNHFEHFDERLDDWGRSAATNVFVDSIIIPGNIEAFSPKSVFRHYNPDDMLLTFNKTEYDLNQVLAAVQDLDKRTAEQVAENPYLRFGYRSLMSDC